MSLWSRVFAVMFAFVCTLAWNTDHAHARSRLFKTISTDHGLQVVDVRAIAQDQRGFIWIATSASLARYDGRTIVRWAPDVLDEILDNIATSPHGEVLVSVAGGKVYRITETGVTSFIGPDGKELSNIIDMRFGKAGALWLIDSKRKLWRRTRANRWYQTPSFAAVEKQWPFRLHPTEAGTMYVGTWKGVWRLTGDKVQHIAKSEFRVVAIAVDAARDEVHFLTFKGLLMTASARGVTKRFSMKTRGISLALRQGTLWVGFDSHLVALRRDRAPEKIPMLAGQLMLDREGSLWVATSSGLVHFPEPETTYWDRSDGLRKAHVRYIAPDGDKIHFSGWNEPVQYIDQKAGALVAIDDKRMSGERACVDRTGVLWIAGYHVMLATKHRKVLKRYFDGQTMEGRGCAQAPQGGVWMGTTKGLYWIAAGGEPVARGSLPNVGHPSVWHPFEDSRGTLWASAWETLCSVSADQARRTATPKWTCSKIPGGWHVRSMMETSTKELWVATAQRGILRHGPEGWKPLPGARALVGKNVHALHRARTRGIWIVAAGHVVRVLVEPTGLKIVEQLSRWNGLKGTGAKDIYEDSKGTVWLATLDGVAQVPLSARSIERPGPPVTLVEARLQGRTILPRSAGALPHGENHVELVFAGPAFRDPKLTRFRVRLGPTAQWSRPSPHPVFNFVDLPPGDYKVEVAATIDGDNWVMTTTSFNFHVDRPWYQAPWVWGLTGILLIGLFTVFHRTRMAMRLRLERQRMRIAMDLHDEMGSGLGSIGLLAELSADVDLGESEQQAVAGKIQHTASTLGGALTDIVWSLREHSGEVARLAAYLRSRGQALFPKAEPSLATEFPEMWPAIELSLPVRRALQLIGLEAMHNAAKHAQATVVTLGMSMTGSEWKLWVQDDGVGFEQASGPRLGGGVGLASMRKRAESIGGTLCITAGASGGTRVELTFSPKADDRRLRKQTTPRSHDHAVA